MTEQTDHVEQYQNLQDVLKEIIHRAYDEHGNVELKALYEKLEKRWAESKNANGALNSDLAVDDIVDLLVEELAEIKAVARRVEEGFAPSSQLSLFPSDPAKTKTAIEQELADRLKVVNLVQNEITNRLYSVLSKNISIAEVGELKSGQKEKIERRGHVLTYNRIEKLLQISDREGFDVFIAGLDAIANAQSGKKRLQRELRQTAAVLFDRMMIAAADAGIHDPCGGFSLKAYMEERGLTDEKSLRQQVERDLDIIFGASISWVGRGKSGDFRDLRIIGDKGIKNGIVFYEFTRGFFEHLMNNASTKLLYMQFPVALLRAANAKTNPWAYFLGRRAALHRHMNRGQSNENIIGIETLLSACPDFPTLEEVMATTRDVTRRIIEPFERDMNAQAAAYSWEYQGGERPKTGKKFMAANIIVHWLDTHALPTQKSSPKKQLRLKQMG